MNTFLNNVLDKRQKFKSTGQKSIKILIPGTENPRKGALYRKIYEKTSVFLLLFEKECDIFIIRGNFNF